MLVPIPSNGVGKGWQDMGDGQMAAKMFQFLQRDVNEGRIWYHHTGTKTSSDIITFEVCWIKNVYDFKICTIFYDFLGFLGAVEQCSYFFC